MGFDRVVTRDEKVLLEKTVKRRLQNPLAYGLRSAVRKYHISPYFAFV